MIPSLAKKVAACRTGDATAKCLAEEALCREVVSIDTRRDSPRGVSRTAPLFELNICVALHRQPAAVLSEDVAIVRHPPREGAETLALCRNSGASRASAASAVAAVDAIYVNRRRLSPCASILQGQYRKANVAVDIPCSFSRKAPIGAIAPLQGEPESEPFNKSAAAVPTEIARLQ